MRKILFALALAFGFVACESDKRQSRNIAESDDDVIVMEDSFGIADTAIDYSQPDGLFDDFIYRFMQDSVMQRKRIAFPLDYWADGEKKSVSKESWKYDSIYSAASEYSVIYDGREVEEKTCDSLVKKATIEVIDLKQARVKMYNFYRQEKYWLLRSIDEHYFKQDKNHGFFEFYSRFANDEQFQKEHVHDPFFFKTYDSDNFQEIEGWVSAESWMDYRTYLPSRQLFNTIYDDERATSAYRTFVIGSPSSGMECTLLFKQTNGRWELVRMEN